MLEECVAADLLALEALALEVALDHHLRSDAGMVGADHPQSVLAEHALAAGEHVLQRDVQRMADVQRAGDVGRRHDDRPRLRVRTVRAEQPSGFPMRVPALLDGFGVEDLGKVGHAERRLAVGCGCINLPPCRVAVGRNYPRSGFSGAAGAAAGAGAPPIHRAIQPNTSSYHWIEFFGFSTQWFSSGNTSSRDGMLRRWSAVKAAIPCV